MAHPDENLEVIDERPADDTDAAALEAFDNILDDSSGEEDEGESEEGDPDEGEDEGEEEPETPAIPAPVSFTNEEKEAFSQLPIELQQTVAAIEGRRNAEVLKATESASNARKSAVSDAQGELVTIQRQFADELAQYARMFEPVEPDYGLIATNPQAFQQQMAQFKAAESASQRLAAQAAQQRQEANALEQHRLAQWGAEQQAILAREIPEWSDPVKRTELVDQLIAVGRDLGFDDNSLSDIDAKELLALRKIAVDRVDAQKYRDLVAKNMQQVRSFKGKTPMTSKPGTAQSKGSGQRRAFADASASLKQSGSDADAIRAFQAMGF